MLSLSQILMAEGESISSFDELKTIVQQRALETGSIFFQIDIEPPGYKDRPEDWYDQLEIAFSSAR
ncbi:MAG TPA: hypothetical protein PLE99_05235 [Candidatus Thiothrix moscowensis]|jgi:hypothetical protein|uniref:hypothetical protein n=1 Tax=unclassified Thiothrix TaxID=2636184 RepID=UPI001A266DF6|nr:MULTISPECIES: hypothetical protein [unclassified Thiothrix]MBJ6609203.1 hypothetical protein [Candidatus Thiothrix moscowensis]HRJ52148.1 hypothetical protein [Candidatus Thiothrix moscowensis]HRJ92341.1 hypothetical protein [Candidatus Thiothrix moscowensis]